MKRLILGFMVWALLTTSAAADTGKLRLYHVVTNGDTLSAIAHRYGATLDGLTKLNKLKDHKIKVGALLEVPWPSPTLRKATKIHVIRHKVLPGDSIGVIAVRYGSDARSIKLLNKLPSFKIKIGMVVDVPTAGPILRREDFDYEIQAGDTIHVLASKFRLLHRVIRHLNPGVDLKTLRQGQKIHLIRYRRAIEKPRPETKTKAGTRTTEATPKAVVVIKKVKVSINRAPTVLIAPTPAPTTVTKQVVTAKPVHKGKVATNKPGACPNTKQSKKQ